MNETLKRSISGAVYIVLLLFSIFYSTESFFFLFGIFLLLVVYEFCNLIHFQKALPLFFSGIVYLLFWTVDFSKNNDILLLSLTLIISIKCIFFLFDDRTTNSNNQSKFIYLIGYIILPFIIITKIPFKNGIYNPKIIVSVFILIWTNDTFAYIVGKSIGKTKLLEKISPKKTLEGLLGGIVVAVIISIILSQYYIKESVFKWIITALLIGVFGTIGDLVESKFKRIANVKDSGTIMPGHGGILDRLDSVIFVAPYIYLFYQILNYVTLS
jgi:phosphatidate cytidylyltransferase